MRSLALRFLPVYLLSAKVHRRATWTNFSCFDYRRSDCGCGCHVFVVALTSWARGYFDNKSTNLCNEQNVH